MPTLNTETERRMIGRIDRAIARAARDELTFDHRAREQALFVGLIELGRMIGVAKSTIRTDWRRRVERGDLPAPYPHEGRVKWYRATLLEFLDQKARGVLTPQKPKPARAKLHTPTRPQASSLSAMMNRGG